MKKSIYQNLGAIFAAASAVLMCVCFFFLGAGNNFGWLLCFVASISSAFGFAYCFEAYNEQQRKNRTF